MDQDSGKGPGKAERKRKTYAPPTLTTFGSVEEFTRGSGTGALDTPFPGRVKN